MKLTEMIQTFCEEHENYQFISDYCANTEADSGCIGITLPVEDSYMDMLFALSAFLEANDFDDKNLELSNPMVEELDGRMVVYFPEQISR